MLNVFLGEVCLGIERKRPVVFFTIWCGSCAWYTSTFTGIWPSLVSTQIYQHITTVAVNMHTREVHKKNIFIISTFTIYNIRYIRYIRFTILFPAITFDLSVLGRGYPLKVNAAELYFKSSFQRYPTCLSFLHFMS